MGVPLMNNEVLAYVVITLMTIGAVVGLVVIVCSL
jgi:hypothetical protein